MSDISGINGVSDDSTRHYTPTTEEVRADYCLLADVSRPRQMQFDRWLAEVKAQAVAEWLAERMAAFEKADLEAYEQGETE